MPTLLEALEEKYGFAETSDIEPEPELLMLRLPKRTPRQRWLSFIINSFSGLLCAEFFLLFGNRQLSIMMDNLNTATAEGVRCPNTLSSELNFTAFFPLYLSKTHNHEISFANNNFLSHSSRYTIFDRAACRKCSCSTTVESIKLDRRKTWKRNATRLKSLTWHKTNWKIGMRWVLGARERREMLLYRNATHRVCQVALT